MIIWINGTFGSGKTTTAYELQRRLPHSFVYDPERFGFVLMSNVPREMAKGDFQDYPLWREANFSLLHQLASEYKGTIIIPMTLTNEVYFEEIIGRLRSSGVEVKHFTLSTKQETVKKRLRGRLEGENSWAYQQSYTRLEQLGKEIFATHIPTDNMSIEEVVEEIGRLAGVELEPDLRSGFRKRVDRFRVKWKEISLFK
ncbi:AAA family ATPase [Pseudoneobacillus sp. C159]